MKLFFILPCVPTAQERVRHMVRAGHSFIYKTAKQKINEKILDDMLLKYVPDTPLTGPVVLSFLAVFPIPKSANKKLKNEIQQGLHQHVHKPDLDNLAKQLKDALTRMNFWNDDRQVVKLIAEKKYGENGCWYVKVEEYQGNKTLE